MPNYTSGRDRRPNSEVRKALENELRQGQLISDALKVVGRSRSWYEQQRRQDKEWAALIDTIRASVSNPELRQMQVPDFPVFAERFLHRKIWPHQQNMIDVVEGREPSWLHPSMVYEKGSRTNSRILINVPPNHAKSMTLTVEYCVYSIVKNPNISIILVSKTQEMAKKMLYAIKQRLSHPRYAELQLAFGPPDGWKASADQWTSTRLYLTGERDSGAKDPTIEAIGIGSQLYGARADIVILDDTALLSNAAEWEKQLLWLRQEASTRLGPSGKLVIVGTRVAPVDLYREVLNEDHYADGRVPWTVLKMPAVLEYGDSPEDWQTLWPISDEPFAEDDEPDDEGFYPRWTGPRLADVRNEVGGARWALVYQQKDIEEDATFDPVAVRGTVNGYRFAGPLEAEKRGHPDNLDGFYTVCSMDPAIAGDCAAVAMSVDRQSGKRYVLDCRVITSPSPLQIREQITRMTEEFHPNEWVIEENAFQGFLTQDEVLQQYLTNKGVVFRAHRTGSNKMDPDFGVASMSGLFGTVTKSGSGARVPQGDALIELPNMSSNGTAMLVEQLVTWSPLVKTKYRKQDTVMALWFAELAARRVVNTTQRFNSWHMPNKMLNDRDRSRQMVVNLDELFESGRTRFV